MTLTFAVDSDNDLYVGADGSLARASGQAAVLHLCAHAAKTVLNEMVLEQGEGLPYFEAVWVGAPRLPVWEAAFRARILAVADVVSIDSLTLSRAGNVLSYSATISTIYGTGTVNG